MVSSWLPVDEFETPADVSKAVGEVEVVTRPDDTQQEQPSLPFVLILVTVPSCLAVAWASRRSPNSARLSYIQHFTAGVVIAVISARSYPRSKDRSRRRPPW